RPRVSASPFSVTTRAPRARRATFNSRKRSLIMNRAENPRKVLGKGLNALLSGRTQAPAPPPSRTAEAASGKNAPEDAHSVGIDEIDPNPLQPRRVFQAERLAELAQSIRTSGVVQPLVVRRAGNRFQLVAGERR